MAVHPLTNVKPGTRDLKALSEDYSSAGSHQMVAADLSLGDAAGSTGAAGDTDYLAPIMGNVLGDTLTADQDANYIGGLIGAFSVTGTLPSTFPQGAVLAQVTDGVNSAKANGVVSYIDGDGSVTVGGAAFKAMSNNSTAGSGFNYGLDLFGAAHDGFNALAILKADISLSGSVSDSERLIIASGSAADDAAIVAQVGADAGVADGSLYLSTAGTGAAFLKVSDAWVAITHA